MAQLRPKIQQFLDLKDGSSVGIHVVTVMTASDLFYVPKFNQRTTADVSAATLRRAGAATATITDNASTADSTPRGGNTVTITGGTPGEDLLIVTVHGPNSMNSGDED